MKKLASPESSADSVSTNTPVVNSGSGSGASASAVLTQLRNLNRDPFVVLLNQAMDHGPRGSDLQALAREHPLRWAQLVKIMANLSGFSDRREVRQDVYTHISSMTDEQLENAVEKLEKGEIVDITDYKVVEG